MKKRDYILLFILGVLTIAVSAVFSPEPLGKFLVSGAIEAGNTIVTMVWITWWALVLGFGIAGGVEAWVSSERVSSALEGASVSDIGKASFFGFVSSSCSYSAIATAKNLFKKGASAAAALGAFMFAATNLVIEIGFVIWVLLGWEFVVANYIGGFILIILMSFFLARVVPKQMIATARENVSIELVSDPVCGMDVDPEETDHTIEHQSETYYFCSESCKNSFSPEQATENVSLWTNLTTLKGWKKLADKQWSEWGMLWNEIAIGFIFAGIIAGYVPQTVWTSLFAQEFLGMPLALLWGAVIGAIIGIATFVCSVGNVPFATVLWVGGLPFGGVFSYIYADLIVPPIVDAYREYYGSTFGLVLAGLMFVSAVVSGILTHLIFASVGLIPDPSTVSIATNEIALDYKAFLNGLFTLIFIILYYLHRLEVNDSPDHSEHNLMVLVFL